MTVDLLCLVADKNMEAAVSGLLSRPKALGIRPIAPELIVHPEHDPGCFHDGVEFLRGLRSRAERALVMLDLAWQGVPAESASYRQLALKVGTKKCTDRAFVRFRQVLQQWFPASP